MDKNIWVQYFEVKFSPICWFTSKNWKIWASSVTFRAWRESIEEPNCPNLLL